LPPEPADDGSIAAAAAAAAGDLAFVWVFFPLFLAAGGAFCFEEKTGGDGRGGAQSRIYTNGRKWKKGLENEVGDGNCKTRVYRSVLDAIGIRLLVSLPENFFFLLRLSCSYY